MCVCVCVCVCACVRVGLWVRSLSNYLISRSYCERGLSAATQGSHQVLNTPALYELHWLPIQSRIQFKLCLLIHHIIVGRSPPYKAYISELVTSVAAITGCASLRTVGRQELGVPRTRFVSSDRAFDVAAPKAWNSFLSTLKVSPGYWTVQEAARSRLFLFRCIPRLSRILRPSKLLCVGLGLGLL